MLEFYPITLSDYPLLHRSFWDAEGHGSEHSFPNAFFWGDQRLCGQFYRPLILSRFGKWHAYLYPRTTDFIEEIAADAKDRGIPFRVWGLSREEAEALGADAIVCVRYSSASVMQNAAEVMAYGTAVKFVN